MYRNLTKISTVNMSHEEWLSHRQKSIGGSDASAIIGLNPYSSPYTVWADKLGELPPKEDNEAMRLGRDLEDYVAKRFTEATGKRVRRENNIIINPDYPFAHANVDRVIIGEDAGLECKTTSILNVKRFKNGEYPPTYYVQCVHYMMVTGAKKWYLAVLVLGQGFYWYEIERDEEEIAALARSEEDFWKLVESKQAPAVDGSESTTNTLTTIYADSNNNTVDLFAYDSTLKQYLSVGKQIKELKSIQDNLANQVKAYMQNNGKGKSTNHNVSWVSATRNTFDTKAFLEDHPGADLSKYYKQSSYRTFKVSEIQ